MTIPHFTGQVPSLTPAQMEAVEQAMVEGLGISPLQMMENAGGALARLARERFFAGEPRARRAAVLAGGGSNGGSALACARRLHGWGTEVHVAVTNPETKLSPATRKQLEVVRRLGVDIASPGEAPAAGRFDLVIDGVIGFRLQGDPRGRAATLVSWADGQAAPILALDLPSGLDPASGKPGDPCPRAAATLALALPKSGLMAPGAWRHVGELYLADVGVPPSVYAELGLTVMSPFARGDLLRLG